MMDGEIGCVLVNLLVKNYIHEYNIRIFFSTLFVIVLLNQTSMVIKATKTSQSKRFRRRASTTRSILRRRRISRRVRKCCRVRRKGTMGGARKERVGDRQQLGVELRPVRKCGAGGGRHRVGGDDTVTIGDTSYTVKELTEQRLVIQTNIDGKVLIIKSTSGKNLKNIIPQVWSGNVQPNGIVKDPLNQGNEDTIIQVKTNDVNLCAGKIQVDGDGQTFKFINSVKNKVLNDCTITYITEYSGTLKDAILKDSIIQVVNILQSTYNENLNLFRQHVKTAVNVCEDKFNIQGFKKGRLIIRIDDEYHALTYFEQTDSEQPDKPVSIAIEFVNSEQKNKLRLYVGTKTEIKILLTTRYRCHPSDISFTFDCKLNWVAVDSSLFV